MDREEYGCSNQASDRDETMGGIIIVFPLDCLCLIEIDWPGGMGDFDKQVAMYRMSLVIKATE